MFESERFIQIYDKHNYCTPPPPPVELPNNAVAAHPRHFPRETAPQTGGRDTSIDRNPVFRPYYFSDLRIFSSL